VSGPSPHLSWAELACKDGTPYPVPLRKTHARLLAVEFEGLRAALGVPLRVVSAYRTPAHNRRVGGARHSQHVQGRALDLQPTQGLTVKQLYAVALVQAEDPTSRIRGLGRYRTFVHIDIRPSDRLVCWTGSRMKDATT